MDLWIRTQDKRGIAKINEDIFVIGTVIRKFLNNENCWTDLGTYATEKRALEVLDEIQHKLANTNYDCLIDDYKIKASEIVYQMPKE